jgi:hypothetical protein
MATNLSPTAALLWGFDVELRCGDMMLVEHEGHGGQFRIVCVLNLGPVRITEVALHKFEGQACPWEDRLPEQATRAGSMSRSQ